MLVGVYGNVGSGKNVFVVKVLCGVPEDIPKYLNFNCSLPNCHRIQGAELFDLEDTGKEAIVVWDEAYTEMDNRMSMSDLNRTDSYLLMQSRKNNMSIISISQLNILDVRWRGLENYAVVAKNRFGMDINGNNSKADFHYVITNGTSIRSFTLKYKVAEKVFGLYDTREKVLPRNFEDLKMKLECDTPKKLNAMIDGLAKKIRKNYELGEKPTHDIIKDAMLRLGLNLHYEPYVYVRLRSNIG